MFRQHVPSGLWSEVVGKSRAVFDANEEDEGRNEEHEVRNEHIVDALTLDVAGDVVLRLLYTERGEPRNECLKLAKRSVFYSLRAMGRRHRDAVGRNEGERSVGARRACVSVLSDFNMGN